MKKINGFTLVELLAVIVILAIIMIIAIPSVLSVMKTSRQKSFVEYVQKVRTLGEQTYLSDELNGVTQDTCTVYDIEKDLGLDNTGDYHGYIIAVKENNEVIYYVTLYDDNYMVYGVEANDKFTVNSLMDYTTDTDVNLTKANLAKIAGCSTYTDVSTGTNGNVATGVGVSSSIITSLPEKAVFKTLSLGKYVSYKSTTKSYSPDTSLTGCTTEVSCTSYTLNPSELTLWRVLKINNDGTVDIISVNGSSKNLVIYGKTGYTNLVKALNNAAKAYIDPTYAKDARSFGYNGQTETILDTSILDSENVPWTSSYSDNTNETIGGGDDYYVSDINQMIEATIPLQLDDSHSYWMASRTYYYYSSNEWGFDGRFIDGSGNVKGVRTLYGNDNGIYNKPINHTFRPVVTLKATVSIADGDGTKENPYTLTV